MSVFYPDTPGLCYPKRVMRRHAGTQSGFTVVELVVVVVVIAVMLGGSLLFIHEKDYSKEMNDAQRSLDVARLTQQLAHYAADHGGLPPGALEEPQDIGTLTGLSGWCAALVPKYMKDLPYDPVIGGALLAGENCTEEDAIYSTGYSVTYKDGVVTVEAPAAQIVQPIKASRKL